MQYWPNQDSLVRQDYLLDKTRILWPICAISSFCLFAAKRRHAKRRKDEKNAMQKDEKMK